MNNYITLEQKNILKDICFQVIQKENLPSLSKELKFKSPLYGSKRHGSCSSILNNSTKERKEFKISITTIKPKFIENSNGRFIDKKTKKRYKRVIGEPMTFKEMFNTLAHEIAHLKYRGHNNNHKNFNKHILMQMLLILKENGNNKHYEIEHI